MGSAAKNYNASDFLHFEGLDTIRKKPGMYIGPPDSHGIWILCKEAADNTTDEFLSGRNDSCHIIQSPDGSIWVLDNGKGIPTEMIVTRLKVKGQWVTKGKFLESKSDSERKDKEKEWEKLCKKASSKDKEVSNSLTFVLTKTHAGGKFGSAAYSASIGTHGVGIKATNALSEMFEVYTNYDGTWWHTEFSKGVEKSPVKKAKRPPVSHGIEMKRGTAIHFKPDMSIFSKGSKFDPKLAAEWCRLTAYLNAGYKTTFTDATGRTKTWCYKDGVKDYLKMRLETLNAKSIGRSVFSLLLPNMEIALAFTSHDGVAVEAYTNSSRNVDGGVHVKAMYAALTKAIEPYKLRSHKFTASDLQEGLVGIINYKIDQPVFSSQTKEKLVDTRVAKPCEDTVFKGLENFFKENKTLAKEICRRTAELKALKDQFAENKKALQDLAKAAKHGKFHPKHVRVDCPSDLREFYLVEGDSAFNTSKMARDKNFQEVMPMKGKINNVMHKGKQDKALASEEVMGILVGTGFDPTIKDPISHLRVGKTIFLCDSDPDGGHITSLLLALFSQMAIEVFDKGIIYIAAPPEFMATFNGQRVYGNSRDDVLKKTGGKAKDIRHYKGLGEMSSDILAETAFNPETRRLYQVKRVKKGHLSEFRLLMAEDSSSRKKLLGIE